MQTPLGIAQPQHAYVALDQRLQDRQGGGVVLFHQGLGDVADLVHLTPLRPQKQVFEEEIVVLAVCRLVALQELLGFGKGFEPAGHARRQEEGLAVTRPNIQARLQMRHGVEVMMTLHCGPGGAEMIANPEVDPGGQSAEADERQ